MVSIKLFIEEFILNFLESTSKIQCQVVYVLYFIIIPFIYTVEYFFANKYEIIHLK